MTPRAVCFPMVRYLVSSLSLMLALMGCAGAQVPAAEPSVGEQEPERGSTAGLSCDDLLARYRGALADATGACETQEDCGLYGSFDPEQQCGGATDAATALTLQAIDDDATAASCARPAYSCIPRERALCVNDRCAVSP